MWTFSFIIPFMFAAAVICYMIVKCEIHVDIHHWEYLVPLWPFFIWIELINNYAHSPDFLRAVIYYIVSMSLAVFCYIRYSSAAIAATVKVVGASILVLMPFVIHMSWYLRNSS